MSDLREKPEGSGSAGLGAQGRVGLTTRRTRADPAVGFPVFKIAESGQQIDLEDIKRDEDESTAIVIEGFRRKRKGPAPSEGETRPKA